MKPDTLRILRGISTFSHGNFSYLDNTFDRTNIIFNSAKRFPINIIHVKKNNIYYKNLHYKF